MSDTPRLLWEGKAFRIVVTKYNESKDWKHGQFAIERAEGRDALGTPRWRAHEGESLGLVYELVAAFDSMRAERDHFKLTAERLADGQYDRR